MATVESADDALDPIEAAGARYANWSPSEYVSIIYGLDAAEHDDAELVEAMIATVESGHMQPEQHDGFSFTASANSSGLTDDVQAAAGTLKQVEAAADSVLTPAEAAKIERMNATAAEFLKQEYGINPGRFNDEQYLIEAVSDTQGGAMNTSDSFEG